MADFGLLGYSMIAMVLLEPVRTIVCYSDNCVFVVIQLASLQSDAEVGGIFEAVKLFVTCTRTVWIQVYFWSSAEMFHTLDDCLIRFWWSWDFWMCWWCVFFFLFFFLDGYLCIQAHWTAWLLLIQDLDEHRTIEQFLIDDFLDNFFF